MGILGPIFMAVFWILILVAVVFLVKWLVEQSGRRSPSRAAVSGAGEGTPAARRETALDILDRRYASGEITREQYLQMKADLERPAAAQEQPPE